MRYPEHINPASCWHAFPGGVHGLLLDPSAPDLTLSSYKFHLPRAFSFACNFDGVIVTARGEDTCWSPHSVSGRYRFGPTRLSIEALFVGPDTAFLRWMLEGGSSGELVIRGGSLHGLETRDAFRFQSKVECEGSVVHIQQEISIPDYRRKPFGPPRLHRHRLRWSVSLPGMVRESESAQGPGWECRIPITAEASSGCARILIQWLGPSESGSASDRLKRKHIPPLTLHEFAGEVARKQLDYERLLARLPPIRAPYDLDESYRRLYQRAWVCIWQNISGPLATTRKEVPGPSAFVSKVDLHGFGPAQWETSLVGYLVSFLDAGLGIRIIQSVLECVEEDGFIPEDLVFNRDVKLGSNEGWMLEQIAARTGRGRLLARNFQALYRSLLFHAKHPGFHYLDPHGSHMAIQNYFSLRALERFAARHRKRDHNSIRVVREDLAQFLDHALEGERGRITPFEFLDGYLDAEAVASVIDQIERRHFPSGDGCFLHQHPDGINPRDGSKDGQALKMVFYLHLIPALERQGAFDLIGRIVRSTWRGIERAGDFWETYQTDGQPRGNGPMGVFGAFGWIWLLMDRGTSPCK